MKNKFPLKLVRAVFLILLLIGTAGIVCSRYMDISWMMYPGLGVIVIALAFYLKFNRCPYCGEFLSKDVDNSCRNCKKKID